MNRHLQNLRTERGVALVMAMIILLVLTILGVTIMGVSGLEAKMAGNTQESTRAFQLAESANEQIINDPSISHSLGAVGASTTRSFTSTTTTVTFIAKATPPGRSSDPSRIESALSGAKAHFEIVSRSQTTLGGKADVTQGASRDIPK